MKTVPLCAALLASVALSAHAATSKPRSWVQLSTRTSALKYVTGAPINVTLIAKNTHARAAFLKFPTGQHFDAQLFKPGARTPVYTWSAGKQFRTSGHQLRLASGQIETIPFQIGDEQGALVPGKYILRAFLTNSSKVEALPVAIEVVPAPMQLKVSLDKTHFPIGEPLAFRLSLVNTSKSAQEIRYFSGQRFDISIVDATGKSVWNWAANKRFTRSISRQTLAPGQTQTFEATWDGQPLPDAKITPGTYTVSAVSSSEPRVDAAPIQIEIK